MPPSIALISLYDHHSFETRNLHAILRKNNIETHCIFYKYFTFKMERSTEEEINILIKLLKELAVDFVCINVFPWFFKEASRITDRIRKSLDIPIAWFGFHPTLKPDDCIKVADFLLVGEPEETILEFVNHWERIYEHPMAGIWLKKGNEIIKSPSLPLIDNLDKIPLPDFDDVNKYAIEENSLFHGDPVYSPDNFVQFYECTYRILASRGCPFDCSYCYNSALKGAFKCGNSFVRRRGVDSVIKELKFAKEQLNVKKILFQDGCFAADFKWASDFSRAYKNEICLPFYCEIHPEIISEELISMLCEAGLTSTMVGIQSGSEYIREQYFNRYTPDKLIIDKTNLLKKYNIGIHYELITDNPFEKEEDKSKTLGLLLKLPRPLYLNIFSLNFFPETELTKKALACGLISEEEIEGNSDRGMRQFILKRPNDGKDTFWNCIYFLASDFFCSSGKIRGLRDLVPQKLILLLSSSQFIKRHPGVIIKSIPLLNGAAIAKRSFLNSKKFIPQMPILFLRILIFSSVLPIVIYLIEPKKLLKALDHGKKNKINNRKLEKITKYTNFIMNLWPWHKLKNICLIRSTILYYFLRQAGIDVRINFGVKKEKETLIGHSWLTSYGEVYLEESDIWKEFELIYSFPS